MTAAHVVDARHFDTNVDNADLDVFVSSTDDRSSLRLYLLGKLLKLSPTQTEGGKEIIAADAAFIKYPQPQRPGCSLERWSDEGVTFCLDDNDQDDYVERVNPLTIRGRGGDVYQVIGSKPPTAGLKVTYSGSTTGPHGKEGRIADGKVLVFYKTAGDVRDYVYRTTSHLGSEGGDSGSPIYTVPDTEKNTYIVGVVSGILYVNRVPTTVFSYWDDTADALNLKPITR